MNSLIGRAVKHRRFGLHSATAVILQESRKVKAIALNGDIVTLEREAKHKELIPGLSNVPSPLFRLETIAATLPEWQRPLGDWIDGHRADLLSDQTSRQLYGLSAASAGDGDRLAQSGLPADEQTWLRMHAAAFREDWRSAIEAALTLEPSEYLDQYWILLFASVRAAERDIRVADRFRQAPNSAPGVALGRFLIDASIPSTLAELQEIESFVGSPNAREPSPGSASLLVGSLTTGNPRPPLDEAALAELRTHHPEAVDDYVDLYRREIRLCEADAPIPDGYLRARLDPVALSDDELANVEHWSELARRLYAQGEAAALEHLPETSDVRHFRALLALRSRDVSFRDDLRTDDIANDVADFLESGTLSAEVLNDPSVVDQFSDLLTEEQVQDDPQTASRWYLRRSLDALFGWEFEEAAAAARSVLRHSRDEDLRDEALNALAYTLYLDGEEDAAIAALERALEGEYSANLQANIGVIAESQSPNQAAKYIAILAAEAPTLELKMAAVRRAFTIWDPDRPAWDDDQDASVVLPPSLRDVLRQLVMEPTPIEDHRWVLKLLAMLDSDWLSNPSNTNRAHHTSTLAHRVYLSRASGDPSEWVKALTNALNEAPNETWLINERDMFVDSIRRMVFESEGSIGPAVYAYEAVDQGMQMDDFDRVVLTSAASISLCGHVAAEGGEPADRFLDLLRAARRALERLGNDQREAVSGLLDLGFLSYGRGVALSRQRLVNEISEALGMLQARLAYVPRRRVDWVAVRSSTQPMRQALAETRSTLTKLAEVVNDPEFSDTVLGFADDVKDMINALDRFVR